MARRGSAGKELQVPPGGRLCTNSPPSSPPCMSVGVTGSTLRDYACKLISRSTRRIFFEVRRTLLVVRKRLRTGKGVRRIC
jgi:hypothetical protein